MKEPKKKEKTEKKLDFHNMVLESERKDPNRNFKRIWARLERKYGK